MTFGRYSGLVVHCIKAPGFGTFNSPTFFAEFLFPKMDLMKGMTVFLRAENNATKRYMFWSSYRSGISSFMSLSRRIAIKCVVDQSHVASLMVSTQQSTKIPGYIVQSLQNSGIRFSWAWEFAVGITIKSSILLLDLLSNNILPSGSLQNCTSMFHGVFYNSKY